LVPVELVEQLSAARSFALRSSAATLLWQWAIAAPGRVPIALLGRLARPVDEDWYVQAPAIAAAKLLMLRRPEASVIFDRLATSANVEERYSAAVALLDLARHVPVAVPLEVAQQLAQDSAETVAAVGGELLRTMGGVGPYDPSRHFSPFGL
jgi:hypothetical protein